MEPDSQSTPLNYNYLNLLDPSVPKNQLNSLLPAFSFASPCPPQNQDCQANQRNLKSSQQQRPEHQSSLWTLQDEKRLQELHNLMGNKWVEISQALRRTENEVKNHYHSKLRKSLRKINRFIYTHLKKDYKPFKMSIISKIIQMAQELFIQSPLKNEEKFTAAFQLKNRILEVDPLLDQPSINLQQHSQIAELIEDLARFNKNKKKPKRLMRNNYVNLRKYQKRLIVQQQGSDSSNQSSNSASHPETPHFIANAVQNNINNLEQQQPQNAFRNMQPHVHLSYIGHNPYPGYFSQPMLYTYLLPTSALDSLQLVPLRPENDGNQIEQAVKKEEEAEGGARYIEGG